MRRALQPLLLLLLAACSNTIYVQQDYQSGVPIGTDDRRLLALIGKDKPTVLATLGAPNVVLEQPTGDIFMYRHLYADTDNVNVNTGLFSAFPIPLYTRVDGERRDDAVLVFFDRDGRVRDAAARRRVR